MIHWQERREGWVVVADDSLKKEEGGWWRMMRASNHKKEMGVADDASKKYARIPQHFAQRPLSACRWTEYDDIAGSFVCTHEGRMVSSFILK